MQIIGIQFLRLLRPEELLYGPNHVKENIDIKVQNGGKVSTLFKMFTLINDLTLNL